ncbi:hypothetical protein [Nocardioides donggukensis]|uniref:DUF4386 family protein n=1 Tax=Nocardioides donggukensis TaxID=2774019 RepID=A0A927K6S4_9ACTN|nr:hypothetical protein [Nocardioides donggukensis]MBD8868871.1 hypothetical protein [Nocardioides donggukensis]
MRRHTATTALDTATTDGQAPVPPPPSSPRTSPALIRAGGTAAQVVAGTYVVGFLVMAAYLVPRGFTGPVEDPAGSLGFLLDHHAVLAGWYLVLYLLGGVAMALVSLGVGQRLAAAPALGRVSTALGLIWSGLLVASGSIGLVGQHAAVTLQAQDQDLALNTWVSTSVVQDALGGGIEVAGALWVAVVGLAALRTRALSAGLGGLALGLAAAGMATVIPIASEVAASIFGIGLIVWFTWLGVALRRR